MIQNKFETITIDNQIYVKVSFINDLYRTLPRKSGTTQKKIVDELQLAKHAAVWRRNKDNSKVGTVATRILNQFKSQSQDIYVDVREIMTPKEGAHKEEHIKLLQMISKLPDLNAESDSDSDPDEPTVQAAAAPITINIDRVLMPIIELEEHEMFRDANDQVFPIEVRGERSKDKILFKAKDVAVFAENDLLVKTLIDIRGTYQRGKDYQILREESMSLLTTLNSSENFKENERINHNLVYLTLAGLIKVMTVSRNANANLLKLFDWLQNLFYVHQFGSHEERNELARSLFKQVLNDKLAGLYCIDLGTFNDLYDTMNISRETYPPEQYGNYRLCKFGLSEDISTRLTQHKNKKTGYGQWSSDVQMKWLILLSPSQLPKAEKILSNLLKADGYTFDHSDTNKNHTELIMFDHSDTNKNHTELIMFDPLKEHKIKQIYRQVLNLYPSKENELSKALEDAQINFETKINLIQANADNDIMKATHETELLRSEMKTQSLMHQNEMLQMQLKMVQMGIK